MRAHRFSMFIGSCVVMLLGPGGVLGHGLPIDIVAGIDGQLSPFRNADGVPLVETGVFAEVAGLISTDSPGFGITNAANGVATNTQLELELSSGLLYWDGDSVTETTAALTIISPDFSESQLVTSETDFPQRMIWAAYDGTSFWESHGLYILEPGSAPHGIYGVGVRITSPSYDASDPFLLPFTYGGSTPESQAAGLEALRSELRPQLLGDVNQDGVRDAADMDAITLQALSENADLVFDVNRDGNVNADDRVYWIESLLNSYLGDSNLDGQFNSSDLVDVFQAAEYEDTITRNSTWATGDWNGDLEFNSTDFIAVFQTGGYDQGVKNDVAAVPEPKSIVLLSSCLLFISTHVRRRITSLTSKYQRGSQ